MENNPSFLMNMVYTLLKIKENFIISNIIIVNHDEDLKFTYYSKPNSLIFQNNNKGTM